MRHARADVLGRLLVVQQALDALPDEQRIAEFTCRALMTVPGTRKVLMHIQGRTIPPDPEFEEICSRCDLIYPITGPPDLSFIDDRPDIHCFPLRTASHRFGFLIVQGADEVLLQPYLGFLGNIANAIAQVLEARLLHAQLRESNERLSKARDELEIRVAERTATLKYLTTHDRLTGLANRALLADRLQNAISHAKRYKHMVAIVYLDLDSFSYVNAGLGDVIGDQFLIEIALRLCSMVRGNDTVARVGSDEFVLLFTSLEGMIGTSARIAKILAAVREPVRLADKEIVVMGSIGASFYPLDGDDHEILLARARAAMYRAKESGGDSMHFYSSRLDAAVTERMELETELRQALPRGELVLHYQPKLDLHTGRIAGAEALMRWNHPRWGPTFPSRFIPVAEESSLIVTVGEWALQQACLEARRWQDAGFRDATVAVNLSARQFRDKCIVETIRRILQETGLDAARLELEVTESSIMHDIDQVSVVMAGLKLLGVTISIDDFGTGYSNLNYLRSFPVDKLKIDQSFVRDIETIESAAAVARAVIVFAQNLNLKVTAEGVETVGQARFLCEHGCDELQGFLISRPLPAERLQEIFLDPASVEWVADIPVCRTVG